MVRFVFVDEAGTSAHEPVTVVVGLVVHADNQLTLAESLVAETLRAVPTRFQDGFVFHAKEVWGDPKYRDVWSMADRLQIMYSMMSIPRKLKLPIAVGMVRRSAPRTLPAEAGFSLEQEHHLNAFGCCLAQADKFMRERAEPNEVGAIIAEDVPEMRQYLRTVPKALRSKSMVLGPDMIIRTEEERRLGYQKQTTDMFVSRIRQNIHFVEKGDDAILQIADACAFGLRRFFSDQDFGDKFMQCMTDNQKPKSDFEGPSSYGVIG